MDMNAAVSVTQHILDGNAPYRQSSDTVNLLDAMHRQAAYYAKHGITMEEAHDRALYDSAAEAAGGDAAYSRQLDERIATLRQRGAR